MTNRHSVNLLWNLNFQIGLIGVQQLPSNFRLSVNSNIMPSPNGTGHTSSDSTATEVLASIEKWIKGRDVTKDNNLVAAVVGCGESETLI